MYSQEITARGYGMTLGMGLFRCWKSGEHKFHINTLPESLASGVWLELRHNGQTIVSASGDDYNNVGNTVILQLETGDVVRVRAKQFAAHGGADQFTTFNAWLIQITPDGKIIQDFS